MPELDFRTESARNTPRTLRRSVVPRSLAGRARVSLRLPMILSCSGMMLQAWPAPNLVTEATSDSFGSVLHKTNVCRPMMT